MMGTDWKFKENPDAKQALNEARRIQTEVIELSMSLSQDRLEEEKSLAAKISFKLGKYFEERDGNQEEAIKCYQETLKKSNQEHKDAMVSIAKIYQN